MSLSAALDVILYAVCIGILIFWIVHCYLHITAIVYGRYRLHKPHSLSTGVKLPGVSILKPLTGIDHHLYTNLESFFLLDYPEYEILFCLEDEMDPAVMIVRSLINKYPAVKTQILIGATPIGANPKVNNMNQGYENAMYELILISDSGICMRPPSLCDMVSYMTEQVGLVHQMPFVSDRKGFAGTLEKVYFGTHHAKMYLVADVHGFNCMTGMSCMFRKHILDEAGGLKSLSCYLAEDFYLAQTIFDRGWKLCICSMPALQNAGTYSVNHFQARMVRWAQLRTALVPAFTILEPMIECLFLGIATSLVVTYLFSCSGLAFFFVHVLIWFLLDYILLRIVQNGPLPFSKFEFVMCWVFRECTSQVLVLRSRCFSQLTWRSRKFRLKWGAIGEEEGAHSCV